MKSPKGKDDSREVWEMERGWCSTIDREAYGSNFWKVIRKRGLIFFPLGQGPLFGMTIRFWDDP